MLNIYLLLLTKLDLRSWWEPIDNIYYCLMKLMSLLLHCCHSLIIHWLLFHVEWNDWKVSLSDDDNIVWVEMCETTQQDETTITMPGAIDVTDWRTMMMMMMMMMTKRTVIDGLNDDTMTWVDDWRWRQWWWWRRQRQCQLEIIKLDMPRFCAQVLWLVFVTIFWRDRRFWRADVK